MKLLAWNTGWNSSQTGVRAQTAAVECIDPDVAFFSEWSPVPTRTASSGRVIRSNGHRRGDELAGIGLVHQCHQHVSDYAEDGQPWTTAHWGILAASRTPIRKNPVIPPLHAPGSWLEVIDEASGLTMVGVRMPAWEGSQIHLRRDLWEWMVIQFERLTRTPTIVMGDFNTRLVYATAAEDRNFGGDLLRGLMSDAGWLDPYVLTGASPQPTYWHKGSKRLDYALVSPGYPGSIDGISAPVVVDRHVTAGPSKTSDGRSRGRLSDHAPVVLNMSVPGDYSPVPRI